MVKLDGDQWGDSGRVDGASNELEEIRLKESEGRVGAQLESEPFPNLGRGWIRDTAGLTPQ